MTLNIDWKKELDGFDPMTETMGELASRLGCSVLSVRKHFKRIDPDFKAPRGRRPGSSGHSSGIMDPRIQADWPGLLARHLTPNGPSLRVLGNEVGCSYEWMRQKFLSLDPDFPEKRKQAKYVYYLERHAKKELALLELAVERNIRCCVCHGLVTKPIAPTDKRASRGQYTCGPECAEFWRVARYRLDPKEKQALSASQARYYLRNAERYPQHIKWAKRFLAGEASTHTNSVRPDTPSAIAYSKAMRKRELVAEKEERGEVPVLIDASNLL